MKCKMYRVIILLLIVFGTSFASIKRNDIMGGDLYEGNVYFVPAISKSARWGETQYCPHQSFAVGYSMKVEKNQGDGDDTAVNGIKLYCKDTKTGLITGNITSNVGKYGDWMEGKFCKNSFLKSASFKDELFQGPGDDTAINSIKFFCLDGEEIQAGGTMPWGQWSRLIVCPDRNNWTSAVCGISTLVQPPQGGHDDMGLIGAGLVCCEFQYNR